MAKTLFEKMGGRYKDYFLPCLTVSGGKEQPI